MAPSPHLVRPCRSPGWTFESSRQKTASRTTLRWPRKAGPRGLRSSPERGGIAAFPLHRPRSARADRLSWDSPTPGSMAEAMFAEPVPLHRRHSRQARCPRCCHRFGEGPPSPPRATDLAVLHDLAGFTCQELAGLLHPAADPGVRCVSAPGRVEPAPRTPPLLARCAAGHVNPLVSRIDSHTPRRTPPPRSRGASPRSLPPRTSRPPPIRDRSRTPVSRNVFDDRIGRALSLEALLRGEVRTTVHF